MSELLRLEVEARRRVEDATALLDEVGQIKVQAQHHLDRVRLAITTVESFFAQIEEGT